MKIYTSIERTTNHIKLSNSQETVTIPAEHFVMVDDESGLKAIKNTATRKTIGLLKV